MGQRETLNLLTVLAMFSNVGKPTRTKHGGGNKHAGTTYGGGGRGTRDEGAIYTPQRRKMKGWEKDHKGNKIK